MEENTRAAFDAALRAGAEYLESDCHLTSDGEVLLFHDSSLLRVAGVDKPVAQATFSEIERLLERRGGALRLEDALREFPDARFNLDVKAATAAEPMGRIIAPFDDRVLVTSFSDSTRRQALAAARANGGEPATSPGSATVAQILLAVRLRRRRLLSRLLAPLHCLQIPERHGRISVLSPGLVTASHEAGVEVHVWTVNDPANARALVGRGVDGIVTDETSAVLAALRSAD